MLAHSDRNCEDKKSPVLLNLSDLTAQLYSSISFDSVTPSASSERLLLRVGFDLTYVCCSVCSNLYERQERADTNRATLINGDWQTQILQ